MSKGTQNCTAPYQRPFLNNKKVPTPPPLFHENEFVPDFKKKAEMFILFLPNNIPNKVTTVNYFPDSITLPKIVYQTSSFQVTICSI